ncbi:MFS transporter [Cohnella zeiphila]|uniref:MFS transporter n=1 Tax=Cohnella zeiphila TaxID=2761120 RepID=A0A7X0SSS9_9BACL|nr:MFS transporter [Cohnella zeiphila]MBB6734220.1 MFS transporter [Cohnella zeiphila]
MEKVSAERAVRPRSVWVAAWMVTAVFILSNSATPLYVHWQRGMGFSNGTLTLIFAAYIAGLLAALLVAGQLSDRFGRKPVLFPGLAAAALACLLFIFATSVAELVAARLLTGIAVGAIVSAGMAAVVDVGGPQRRSLASLAASAAMVLGAGLGPLLAGALAQTLAHPILPVFAAELAILGSAFAVAASLPGRQAGSRAADRFRLRLPSVPAANRLHLIFGIAVFAPGLTATSFILSLGPSLLSKLLAVNSPLVAGGTACLMFLTATGIQFALKRLRIGTQLLAGAASTVLAMLAAAAAVRVSSAPLLVLAAIFAGAGQGLGQLGGLTLIGLRVPERRRAEANAVLNMGGYVPAAVLPVCAGYLIDAAGLAAGTTAFAAVLTAASLAAAGFVSVRLREKD